MTTAIAPAGDAAKRVAAVLAAGGVALIPTDTVYGLVADPEDATAVDRIFEIKGRPESQPIAVLVNPEFPLDRLAEEVPSTILRIGGPIWAGGRLTIVLRRKPGHLDAVAAGAPTVGLRAPDHSFTQQVIASFGRPIAATSANISGQPSPAAFDEVDPAIANAVDLAVDGGRCPTSVHSSVVDFSVVPPKVLRAGAISPAELSASLGVAVR